MSGKTVAPLIFCESLKKNLGSAKFLVILLIVVCSPKSSCALQPFHSVSRPREFKKSVCLTSFPGKGRAKLPREITEAALHALQGVPSDSPRTPLLTLASIIFLAEFFSEGQSASLGRCQRQGNLPGWEGRMSSWRRQKRNLVERVGGRAQSCPDFCGETSPRAGGPHCAKLPFPW